MFPFWQDVVAPLIEAADARRIVEIGALRGENTELMLERLGPDAELHVIDPVPSFDPAEHEQKFAGRYVFHRDLSLNVLPELAPMDVALIDGDHNWYSVFTELTMLADVARRAGLPMPLMILHDVGWPYGRRDLYYDPSNIPEEHQQPWRRGGMRRGMQKLLPGGGGMNANLAHAELEGGERNGVMTGVDDFIAGYDKPLRLLVLPIFFGLAIVVEEERLAAQPALAAAVDRLETPEGKDMLLRLGEEIRVDAVTFDQAILKQSSDRADRLATRYLATIKQALVDDIGGDAASVRAGLDQLHQSLDDLRGSFVRGDMAVVGVGSGAWATFLAAYLETHETDNRPRFRRRLWLASPGDADDGADPGRAKALLDRFDLLVDRIGFLEGDTTDSLAELADRQLAVIVVSGGIGERAQGLLDQLSTRLSNGGRVIAEDEASMTRL